jgi:hypothetical protein
VPWWQAVLSYTTNVGAITITGYSGLCDTVIAIPATINGLPVTSIGQYAFYECTNLTSVTIPASVTTIGYEAFEDCYGLTSVTIPGSVTYIGEFAFYDSGLTNVTIASGVTSIRTYAFYGCTSLTSVTIPGSVTNIGANAFYDCTGLKWVYFQGNAPAADATVFSGDSTATVYYLPGTTGWGLTLGGRPTAFWLLPNPLILNNGPSFGVQTNGFGFIISWATNLSVVVEACTNLASPVWIPLQTNTLTNGSFYFSDPQWTNYPARFYRLRAP